MKKTLLYSMAALASLALASCGDDYDDWASPQSNAQEAAAAKYGVSFAGGSEVNSTLPDEDGTVHLMTVSSTNENVSGFTIKSLSINGTDIAGTVVGNDICVDAVDLEKLVESQYDSRAAVARDIDVKANVSINTASGDALITDLVGDVQGHVTPQPTPALDTKGYYILGGVVENGSGWDLKVPVWMTSTGNGVYTAHVTTTGDGDNWFKFYAGSDYDAESWDKVNAGQMGCETNGDGARHNYVVYEGDPLYTGGVQTPVIKGAGEWDVVLDMTNLTYTVKPAEGKFYITGTPNGWTSSPLQTMFYGLGDGHYSYTTKWTGAWDLKFWKSNNIGDWGAAWGTAKDGDGSESGSLINSNSQSFQSPAAGYYTLTINMNDNTYTWTRLSNQNPTEYTSVSLIGDFNGWGGDIDMTKQSDGHNWYVRYTVPSTGGLKFRANHGWDSSWGTSSDDKATAIGDTYHLSTGSENITVPAGTYDFYLNDITGQWNIVPVE